MENSFLLFFFEILFSADKRNKDQTKTNYSFPSSKQTNKKKNVSPQFPFQKPISNRFQFDISLSNHPPRPTSNKQKTSPKCRKNVFFFHVQNNFDCIIGLFHLINSHFSISGMRIIFHLYRRWYWGSIKKTYSEVQQKANGF